MLGLLYILLYLAVAIILSTAIVCICAMVSFGTAYAIISGFEYLFRKIKNRKDR